MGLFKKHIAEKSVNIGVFIICLWFHQLEIGRYHLECFPHADSVLPKVDLHLSTP
jgi:hypothetical protein